ncbi:MAG: fumarylacetoacetate hydrolase family protein [Sphingomonadaceae bacterium]|nr:fumarylacetoacetate hydrolase family protein [Sphingomonadaceae bacterium]
MKLATYRYDDATGPGAVVDGGIVDLRSLAPTLFDILSSDLVTRAAALARRGRVMPCELERLCAPIPLPRFFLGVGMNYRDHAIETCGPIGDCPTIFAKLAGAAAAPYSSVIRPVAVSTLDYEGELGVVIAHRCSQISVSDAARHVAGYVVVNDLTVRAYARPETLVLAKSGATHGPFGPWITTTSEINDPHKLTIRTWVNGELRQNSSTAQMQCNIWELIAHISAILPLEAGDIITTGSPAGSGAGQSPPRFLEPGDVVRVEIEGLGAIENKVVAE